MSIVEEVGFTTKEAKSHARRYFTMMGKSINTTLHAWVITECITVKVAEFRVIPF